MTAIGNKRTLQGYLAGVCAMALAGCATTMAEPAPTPATGAAQTSAPQASADIGTGGRGGQDYSSRCRHVQQCAQLTLRCRHRAVQHRQIGG